MRYVKLVVGWISHVCIYQWIFTPLFAVLVIQQSFPLDKVKLHSDVDLLSSYPTLCVLSLLSLSFFKKDGPLDSKKVGKTAVWNLMFSSSADVQGGSMLGYRLRVLHSDWSLLNGRLVNQRRCWSGSWNLSTSSRRTETNRFVLFVCHFGHKCI